MNSSTSERCKASSQSLRDIVSSLSAPDSHTVEISVEQVQDQQARFGLWMGNIGALHQPESPLSVESRLSKADDILYHISGLLDDINDAATELLDIVSGARDGERSLETLTDGDTEEKSEEKELLGEIETSITALFRTSKLIRQGAPTDPFVKALSRNRYRFNDQYDIAHVGEKFPKLASKEFTWLRRRLGQAITQRRHYLSYVQDHQQKLSSHEPAVPTAEIVVPKLLLPSEPSKQAKPLPDSTSRPSTFFTSASTLAPERISPQMLTAKEDLHAEDDAVSRTTVSRSTVGDLDSSTAERIPKLEDLRQGANREFECPFCCRIQRFKNEKSWRRHVFSDLRSYACTFPDCNVPLFGDAQDWFNHEMQVHRVNYTCQFCHVKSFSHEDRYLAHMRRDHAELVNDDQRRNLLQVARKPCHEIFPEDCPCCSTWAQSFGERTRHADTLYEVSDDVFVVTPEVFRRHLGSHLEQLALFAVPNYSAADEDDGSNVVIAKERDQDQDMPSLGFDQSPTSSRPGDDEVLASPDLEEPHLPASDSVTLSGLSAMMAAAEVHRDRVSQPQSESVPPDRTEADNIFTKSKNNESSKQVGDGDNLANLMVHIKKAGRVRFSFKDQEDNNIPVPKAPVEPKMSEQIDTMWTEAIANSQRRRRSVLALDSHHRLCGTAQYEYKGLGKQDLNFPKGAAISSIIRAYNNWWTGSYEDSRGIFPARYLQVEDIDDVWHLDPSIRSPPNESRKAKYGTIGICALDAKARSRSSQEIVKRLLANGDFTVCYFEDELSRHTPVAEWSICDYLMCWDSEGFPLHQAMIYEKLRQPFCVNNLAEQTIFWDRRLYLRILSAVQIRTPKRIEVSRDGGPRFATRSLHRSFYTWNIVDFGTTGTDEPDKVVPPPKQIEMKDGNDVLVIDGQELRKPFVEKPVFGRDHDVRVYLPKSQGGGGIRIFRKWMDRNSERDESLSVPRCISDTEGSYIYEEYLTADNAEVVKVYAVDTSYCHAEARKSPAVDGIVKRGQHGKEIRYVTPLSDEEKDMTVQIVRVFKQTICGFDVIRSGGKNYVIDVHGWKYSKVNEEYYDHCARILREMFIKEWELKTTLLRNK